MTVNSLSRDLGLDRTCRGAQRFSHLLPSLVACQHDRVVVNNATFQQRFRYRLIQVIPDHISSTDKVYAVSTVIWLVAFEDRFQKLQVELGSINHVADRVLLWFFREDISTRLDLGGGPESLSYRAITSDFVDSPYGLSCHDDICRLN